MALNKRGKVEIATVLVWVLIVGAIAYVANFGGFQETVNGFLGGGTTTTPSGTTPSNVLTDTKDCPTSGKTTYTINTQDALSSTATSLYPEYYIFNGNMLIKEGTLSTTDNTIDLSCGKDYEVLLINTTSYTSGPISSTNTGIYPKVVTLKARIAEQTLNEKLYSIGEGKIFKIVNLAEGDGSTYYANMTLAPSSEKNFNILFGQNMSEKAFRSPLIICDVNVTEIASISISSFSDGTPVETVSVPKRLTSTAGRTKYAWGYTGILDLTKGPITAVGTVKATANIATVANAGNAQNMSCTLVDRTMWKTASYKTASSIAEAFPEGAENAENLADVGGDDSADVPNAWVAPQNWMSFYNARGV